MIRVVVSGACGKMGKAVTEMIKTQEDMKAIAGFDIAFKEGDLTIYNDLNKIPETTDVIIDFSNPSIIKELTEYTVSKGVALAVGTTGLEEEHKRMLYSASKTIPVFVSHNMCLGVSLLLKLAKEAAGILTDYDIEIVEKHHNQKIDAPSGTALMIADSVKEVRQQVDYIYNRSDVRKKRDTNEIGIHSIRGGNLIGEHTVLFIGEDETIQISHNLTSRKVLAAGAVKVIRFIAEQKPGYYSMQDLLNNLSI
ncbi:MAG TPA: 4-hydroxy-tetrahydrodipicolinate reductase [Thermoanaerobacterales bacterium]|jgi:4-hydroxy-tetrahydrodipicolinate reductase|nr:4-hydroxy-tetrahydrodipicolinate reductase [Thermoanaerobacterales bacterium]